MQTDLSAYIFGCQIHYHMGETLLFNNNLDPKLLLKMMNNCQDCKHGYDE